MANIEEIIRRIKVQTLAEGGAAARADMARTADAYTKLGEVAGQAAIISETQARKQLSANAAFDKAVRSVDGVAAATKRFEDTVKQLARGLQQGERGQDKFNAALDLASLNFQKAVDKAEKYQISLRAVYSETQKLNAATLEDPGKRRAVNSVVDNARFSTARDREADTKSAFNGLDVMREQFVPRAKAEREQAEALEAARKARSLGAFKGEDNGEKEYAASVDRINARFHDQVTEIDKAEKAHKRLANGAGLSAYAYQNLGYQVNDVVTSLASGISPMQTFAQQGGQILQVLQMGDGGIKGALKGIATTSIGFVTGISAMAGALTGIGAAFILGGLAAYSYSSKTTELGRQLQGLGASSGATVAQINALADASAGAAGVSIREFRSLAGAFAATGEIGVEMYASLIKSAKDFSRTSGQDLKTVGAELAAAFAAPAKGAEELDKKYNILNFTQLELIRRLDAQGNKLGAQKVLQEAYASSIDRTGETVSGWGRISGQVADFISDKWTKAGQAIDKVVNGGTLEEQLEGAKRVLSESQALQGSGIGRFVGGLFGQDPLADSANVARIEGLIKRRDEAMKKADSDKDGKKAGEFLKGLSPAEESIKKLEDGATDLESKMNAISLDKRGEAKRAIEYLRLQAAQMREDLEKGGANLANSLRDAQFNNKMVGAVGYGRDAASINKKYDDETTEAFRKAGTNIKTDEFGATLQSIDQRRQLDLDTLEKESTLTLNKVGAVFSRLAPEVQEQLKKGVQRFPNVPLAALAAIVGPESSGNLDIGYTKQRDANGKVGTAYGLGQIVRTTGNEIKEKYGIDRMDRSTMGEAMAAVFQTKLDRPDVNGDVDKAIMAYRGHPDPAVNRAYLAKVKRGMGEMGDPSVAAQATTQDASSRALRDTNEELRRNAELYGVNTEKMNSQAAAQTNYNRLIDAGMAPNEEFRKSLLGIAAAAEAASRTTQSVKFTRDQEFARDQLGRTDNQQQAYSQARGIYGDINDPRAKDAIVEITKTQDLTEAKNLVRDGAQGFVSELRRTGDAAGALANVFGNIADKMISKVLDSLVSSAFGTVAKGGLSALLPFANGGIMTSRGAMPLHAYSSGGIANSPQMALFGEGRTPEAYVPLPDGKRIPVAMSQPANANSRSVTDARRYAIDLRGSTLTMAEVQTALAQALGAYDANLTATFGDRQADWRESA